MLREIILGYPYLKTKKLIQESEFWSSEKLNHLQRQLLGKTLDYARKNIPYYLAKMDTNQWSSDDDPINTLKLFPIIGKEEIRSHLKDFIKIRGIRAFKATTGGSTGHPFVFYLDRFTSRQKEKAFMFDQWSRVGYRFGDPIFNLRGRAPKKNKFIEHDRFFNIYFASSFDINESHINKYTRYMNEIRPMFLHGYPSTIYQMALLLDSSNKNLNFQFKAVFCGSEKLFGFQREKIEKVFKCRVFSWYGHSEYLNLGGECEHSSKYHFYPQYGYTELLPTGLKDEAGRSINELVATGFNNFVMPLIRYRTGDYAIVSESQECACGRNYLLIDEILGREQEFIIDKSGFSISATSLIFGQHFEAFEGINAMQINQNTIGEIDIVIDKNDHLTDAMILKMKDIINQILGDRLDVSFTFSSDLVKSPIGKARLVNQELDIRSYLN